ncbi:MAG: choice-of-anchor C family protein [Candidatus Eremiobacteraeota bacterium]|nr:choice-of-anchor C family protein [Candidatus Eremiobacteraeota bacterium]
MRSFLAGITLLLTLAMLTPGVQAQSGNVLINGSFEQGPKVGSSLPLTTGSRDIPGWVVTGPVDYIGSFWVSSDGVRSIDLDGTPGPGAIAQTFSTEPGKNYEVAFDMAANTDGPPQIKRMTVAVAGTVREFDFDMTGHAKTSMGWQRKSFVFRAVTGKTTLEFASLSRRGNWNGAGLDNVSVTATSKGPDAASTAAPPAPVATPAPAPSPVAKVAPRIIRSSVTDLSGTWIGNYPTKPLHVNIAARNGDTVATFLDSDGYVPVGKISWSGKNTGRTFFVRQVCAKRGYSNPTWKLATVVVANANAFQLFITGCGNAKIDFHRVRL